MNLIGILTKNKIINYLKNSGGKNKSSGTGKPGELTTNISCVELVEKKNNGGDYSKDSGIVAVNEKAINEFEIDTIIVEQLDVKEVKKEVKETSLGELVKEESYRDRVCKLIKDLPVNDKDRERFLSVLNKYDLSLKEGREHVLGDIFMLMGLSSTENVSEIAADNFVELFKVLIREDGKMDVESCIEGAEVSYRAYGINVAHFLMKLCDYDMPDELIKAIKAREDFLQVYLDGVNELMKLYTNFSDFKNDSYEAGHIRTLLAWRSFGFAGCLIQNEKGELSLKALLQLVMGCESKNIPIDWIEDALVNVKGFDLKGLVSFVNKLIDEEFKGLISKNIDEIMRLGVIYPEALLAIIDAVLKTKHGDGFIATVIFHGHFEQFLIFTGKMKNLKGYSDRIQRAIVVSVKSYDLNKMNAKCVRRLQQAVKLMFDDRGIDSKLLWKYPDMFYNNVLLKK